MAKPDSLPDQATSNSNMPESVIARLAGIFGVGTTAAAAKPDVGNPPDSVVTLPEQALDGSDHANTVHAHLPDWFA